MQPIVSVDLAYRTYRDTGIAVLRSHERHIECACTDLASAGLSGEPAPDRVAFFLAALCDELGSEILLIDGPQAWKSPTNGLEHSRRCERELNTPAKTGLPGAVKPANYRPFVAFSIAVFDALAGHGWARLGGEVVLRERTVVESFPMAAWKALGLPILPAKTKATAADIEARVQALSGLFPLRLLAVPNHDELQAIVAGFGGVGLAGSPFVSAQRYGLPPSVFEGHWREGFIVTPTQLAIRRDF